MATQLFPWAKDSPAREGGNGDVVAAAAPQISDGITNKRRDDKQGRAEAETQSVCLPAHPDTERLAVHLSPSPRRRRRQIASPLPPPLQVWQK